MKLLSLLITVLSFCSFAKAQSADSLDAGADTARLIFCGGIENELPVGISDKFFLDTAGNRYVYAYYSQSEPLMMKEVMMEIQPGNDSVMQVFAVKPKWKYTFLKCHFLSSGDYRIILYNEKKSILAEGKVTIVGW